MRYLIRVQLRAKSVVRALLNERGDVPGWVLVVLMTAGLVTGIWALAGPRLSAMLVNSLDAVSTPR